LSENLSGDEGGENQQRMGKKEGKKGVPGDWKGKVFTISLKKGKEEGNGTGERENCR